jgi:hypothetical protein
MGVALSQMQLIYKSFIQSEPKNQVFRKTQENRAKQNKAEAARDIRRVIQP